MSKDSREIIIKNLDEILNNKNLFEFKNWIKSSDVKLKCLNTNNFDVLIKAIDVDVSVEFIKFIVCQCQYETLNYIIKKNEMDVSPLSLAILKENFKVADYLINNGSDVNFLKFNLDNRLKKRYMIENGMDITSEFLKDLIKCNEVDLLNLIFKNCVFDRAIILYFINIYKNKISLSNKQIQEKILKENHKFKFNNYIYELAIENNNYKILEILLRYDNRKKDVIIKNLFQLGNEKKLREKKNKINDVIKSYSFNLQWEKYMDNFINMEERINLITELFIKNDLKELKLFIKKYNFPMSYFNQMHNDFIILSIENSTSVEIINFIIKLCQPKTLNYTLSYNNEKKTPLLSAISKEKFEIANILIKNNANINYKIDNDTIINYLYRHISMNKKILKYLLNTEVHISSKFINVLIASKQNELLYTIFRYFFFNSSFIVKLLDIYKKGQPLSNKQLQAILSKEKNKINIKDIAYKEIIVSENVDFLKFLLQLETTRKREIFKYVIAQISHNKNFLIHFDTNEMIESTGEHFFLNYFGKIDKF
eukprot:jgi/Orpsp1_1/1180285/evm.model.c7180000072785.1